MASKSVASENFPLELNPDSSLQFVLTKTETSAVSSGDGVSRCVMKLTNPTDSIHYAFKVKTTQPRRYLVRPNQGVIGPGGTDAITIILVEKDKNLLLQSYESLGQSALDNSKDKFLVQSSEISSEKASQISSAGSNTDLLTSFWGAASSKSASIKNKKLHVKHIVESYDIPPPSQPSLISASPEKSSKHPLFKVDKPSTDGMSKEQILTEVSSLRRKYDELVAFAVNLTAERDILNNTLEQTKRDLTREVTARASLENSGTKEMKMQQNTNFTSPLVQSLFVGIACFLAGIKAAQSGTATSILEKLPFISSFLGL